MSIIDSLHLGIFLLIRGIWSKTRRVNDRSARWQCFERASNNCLSRVLISPLDANLALGYARHPSVPAPSAARYGSMNLYSGLKLSSAF